MKPKPYLEPMPLRGRVTRDQPKGLPIINVGFNELPYPPFPSVRAALQQACEQVQSYGSPRCDGLRAALSAQTGIDPDHIICGNGSEELLDVIARCFVRPGDEVLISEFGYIQFALTAHRLGATLIKAPETDFTTDLDALRAAICEHTRLIFLANPNNPTGTMVSVDALRQFVAGVPDDVVLVLDLAYGEFAMPVYCAEVHALVETHENLIVTRTFSKAHGLAGVRVGWAHAAEWLINVLYAARGMGTVNALAQAGAEAALKEQEAVLDRIKVITSERARLTATLEDLDFEVIPSAANFLMTRPPGGSPDITEALVDALFDEGGFIVNRTRETGLEEFFRFSLSTPDFNDKLLDCIKDFVASHG